MPDALTGEAEPGATVLVPSVRNPDIANLLILAQRKITIR
jgi:hypothetical protein